MNDDIVQMVKDCLKRKSKLTEWEEGFIQAIYQRIQDEEDLTDHQLNWLEKIWDRIT